jgi:hypothetical protein
LIATLGFGLAQIAQVAGLIGYPVADILIYSTSLGISAPYLIAILALHETVKPQRQLWTRGAMMFGVMYVTYVALMYTVQLSVVIPRSMHAPATSVLAVSPQSLFWDIDALGYVAMGLSALFAGFSLSPTGPGLMARRFLLAHGLITPVIAFNYFYPHFSIAVLLLGAPWLITAPGSLLALAAYFRRLSRLTGSDL